MPYLLEVESALRTSTLLNGVSGISKSTRQRVPKSLLLIIVLSCSYMYIVDEIDPYSCRLEPHISVPLLYHMICHVRDTSGRVSDDCTSIALRRLSNRHTDHCLAVPDIRHAQLPVRSIRLTAAPSCPNVPPSTSLPSTLSATLVLVAKA